MSKSNQHPLYTEDKISQYVDHIQLFPQGRPSSLAEIKETIAKDPLQWLTKIQRRQMATVPFENLALHYSDHHNVYLELDYLFDKIVRRRRGGYCMENNSFFATVLRTLGYEVLSGGARVSNAVMGRMDGCYGGL